MVSTILHYARFLMKPERLRHTISVRDFALKLAYAYGIDPRRVEIAAVSHDLFRDVRPDVLLRMARIWEIDMEEVEEKHPVLLHGKIAGEFLRRRFECHDEEIILAVSYHTSSHPDMGGIGKILVVSDTVGYDRDFPGVEELREIALKDLEEAFLRVLENRLTYAISTRRYLLPKSVETWNRIVEVVV